MDFNEYAIYQPCIEASSACAVACLRCAKQVGLQYKNEQITEEIEEISELLFACAAICLLNLKSLASESEFLQEACNKCEEMCVACEKKCEKFGDSNYFKITAIACGNCAMECKIISEM
jgi:hypothetical protein